MDYSIESGNQAYSLVALHSVAACIDSENPKFLLLRMEKLRQVKMPLEPLSSNAIRLHFDGRKDMSCGLLLTNGY